jgi:CHASE2 domain-containing sensor protein
MPPQIKKPIPAVLISLILAVTLIIISYYTPVIDFIHWKLYDILVKIEYGLRRPPPAIKDIVLVTIDNETLKNMQERWPYPRADFAEAIECLRRAGARVIAFDFVFLGRSTPYDDELLKTALEGDNKVILATSIDEKGSLDLSPVSSLTHKITSGIITKVQDQDGITRKNLTYLVSTKEPNKGFLSWEMQILKTAKSVDLLSLVNEGPVISFRNDNREKWLVPVDPLTKTFLIHFRGHSLNFKLIPFYKLLAPEFDPAAVKDKIVLIGLFSSLFGDLHNTPLGWLPGITLNANALLTLYAHDFLKTAPRPIEIFISLLGVILSTFFILTLGRKQSLLLVTATILLFFALSYILLIFGCVWNYSLFPALVSICPLLSKKIAFGDKFKRF